MQQTPTTSNRRSSQFSSYFVVIDYGWLSRKNSRDDGEIVMLLFVPSSDTVPPAVAHPLPLKSAACSSVQPEEGEGHKICIWFPAKLAINVGRVIYDKPEDAV